LLCRLADIDNVVAIKQSTSLLRNFVDTVFALDERVRVFGYAMDDHGLTLLAARGGDGTMGSGGALGRDHPDFFNHLWKGDLEAARLCGQRDRLALSQWFNGDLTGRLGSAAATMKAALNLQGVPGGYVRAPLHDLDDAAQQVVRGTLETLGKI
jgi:4-hydroxy-tetrahydrodipicolinate synthase